jgi:hypothetical protein
MGIEIGDIVTVRPHNHPNALGIRGCTVLGFGKTEDGQPAAKLDGGRFGEFNALVADLTKEEKVA